MSGPKWTPAQKAAIADRGGALLVSAAAGSGKTAVLTGVSFEPGKIGAMAYDSATDSYSSYFNEKLPVSFHGTGDVFASACVGALMNGKDLTGALKIAVDYTLECIRLSRKGGAC